MLMKHHFWDGVWGPCLITETSERSWWQFCSGELYISSLIPLKSSQMKIEDIKEILLDETKLLEVVPSFYDVLIRSYSCYKFWPCCKSVTHDRSWQVVVGIGKRLIIKRLHWYHSIQREKSFQKMYDTMKPHCSIKRDKSQRKSEGVRPPPRGAKTIIRVSSVKLHPHAIHGSKGLLFLYKTRL